MYMWQCARTLKAMQLNPRGESFCKDATRISPQLRGFFFSLFYIRAFAREVEPIGHTRISAAQLEIAMRMRLL